MLNSDLGNVEAQVRRLGKIQEAMQTKYIEFCRSVNRRLAGVSISLTKNQVENQRNWKEFETTMQCYIANRDAIEAQLMTSGMVIGGWVEEVEKIVAQFSPLSTAAGLLNMDNIPTSLGANSELPANQGPPVVPASPVAPPDEPAVIAVLVCQMQNLDAEELPTVA